LHPTVWPQAMPDHLHLGIACATTATFLLLFGGLLFHPFLGPSGIMVNDHWSCPSCPLMHLARLTSMLSLTLNLGHFPALHHVLVFGSHQGMS